MIISVHQPQYLPWIGYFDKIIKSDLFVFLDNVQYKKREFQNRNKIRTPDTSIWLTVPVLTKNRFFQKINEVLIDNETDWQSNHLKSIEHNYRTSKYFNDFFQPFKIIYEKNWTKLIDINLEIINLFLKLFQIKTPFKFESELKISTSSTQRIVDICKQLGADTYLSGVGGKFYLDEALLKQNNIKLLYQDFIHPVYTQNYPNFEVNLSIIDYLFNCGLNLNL